MMLNPSRTYFRCDACGKSMPTEGNHNDPGDGTDLCPACFQKPIDRRDGKEGGKAKTEKKAIGQTQPPTAERQAAARPARLDARGAFLDRGRDCSCK